MINAVPPHLRLKAAIYIVAILGLTTFFVWVVNLDAPRPPDTAEDGCPLDPPVRAHTLVLVDNTDPFTPPQQDRVHLVLKTLRQETRQFERVTVAVIRDQPPKVLFSRCNPGVSKPPSGLREMFGRSWHESWLRLEARFEAEFDVRLREDIRRLDLNQTACWSPILQTIAHFAGTDEWRRLESRRVVIFSDLMENVSGFSHYTGAGGTPAAQTWQTWHERHPALRSGLDLARTRFEVHYVRMENARHIQGPGHERFWRDALERNGAKVTVWTDLQPGDVRVTRARCS